MRVRSNLEILSWTILCVLLGVIFLLAALGCGSTRPEPQIIYKEVKVPVPIQGEPLPIPPAPEWETENLDPESEAWVESLRAIVRDLLRAWAHIEELRYLIDSHNGAIADP